MGHGTANDAVLEDLQQILATLRGMNEQVVRVGAAGDRKFRALQRPGWEAHRQPEVWVFSMPVMGHEQLAAIARSLSGCFVLIDLHHLLKTLRYRVLMDGPFASLFSWGCLMVLTRELWQALHFSKAAPGNDAWTKMDDGLAAPSSPGRVTSGSWQPCLMRRGIG
jgi:hypothetical protein